MEALLTAVSSVFTSAVGWVGTVASTINGQPVLLLFCVAVPRVVWVLACFPASCIPAADKKTKPGPTPWRGRALSLMEDNIWLDMY